MHCDTGPIAVYARVACAPGMTIWADAAECVGSLRMAEGHLGKGAGSPRAGMTDWAVYFSKTPFSFNAVTIVSIASSISGR